MHRYLTTWRDEVHEEQPSARTEDEFLDEHGFRERLGGNGQASNPGGGISMETAEPTWQPYERHGDLTTRSDLPDTVFAFPKQRKEPLTDAAHVRNAVARFDQVIDVPDADRAVAFANIEKAARYYDVDLSETNWHQLGVHPQPNREESARKGAETRMRTGEAEEAALKGAATRERLGITEEAAKKAAATRRREREEAEGHQET